MKTTILWMHNKPHKDYDGIAKLYILTPTDLYLWKGEDIPDIACIARSERVSSSRKKDNWLSQWVEAPYGSCHGSLRIKKDGTWFDESSWKKAIICLRRQIITNYPFSEVYNNAITSINTSDKAIEAFIRRDFPVQATLLDIKEWYEKSLLSCNYSHSYSMNYRAIGA